MGRGSTPGDDESLLPMIAAAAAATMQAAVFRRFGGPENLALEQVARPVPMAGEVLIEVRAVSVNRTLDCALRAGTYAYLPALPHICGVDASGVVVALGEDVVAPPPGTRVVTRPIIGRTAHGTPMMTGVHVWGGYAQYMRVPAANLRIIPDALDFATATVVARHFPLAFAQLRDHGRLQPGEWVLVMGAAGGLGAAAVQTARHLGGHVIAGAGADERVRLALGLGARAGINYRTQSLDTEVARITEGRGVDLVLDNLGDPDLFPRALRTLRSGGRLVTAGAHAGGIVPLDVRTLYQRQLTVIGAPVDAEADYDLALRAAADGHLKVQIEDIIPLRQAAAAHRRVEASEALGKIVLDPWH